LLPLLLLLLQVALRRVLQVVDPRMTDAETSSYIRCSSLEPDTDWCAAQLAWRYHD
jgi:hypothetical protein